MQKLLNEYKFSSFSLTNKTFLGLTDQSELISFPLNNFPSKDLPAENISLSELKEAFNLTKNTENGVRILLEASENHHILAFESWPEFHIVKNKENMRNYLSNDEEFFKEYASSRAISSAFCSNRTQYKLQEINTNRNKFDEIKEEIHRLFSKDNEKPPQKNQFQELIKDLDQAFTSQRISINKNQSRLDTLASEIKKFTKKPLEKQEILLEELPLKSLQNFSFSQPKPKEKPLDYFLTLINSQQQQNTQFPLTKSPSRSSSRSKTPEVSIKTNKKSFLSHQKSISNQKKPFLLRNNENEGFSLKKLSKRMFTFGLDNENEGCNRKKSPPSRGLYVSLKETLNFQRNFLRRNHQTGSLTSHEEAFGLTKKSQPIKIVTNEEQLESPNSIDFYNYKKTSQNLSFYQETEENNMFLKENSLKLTKFQGKKLDNSAVFSVNTENFLHNTEFLGSKDLKHSNINGSITLFVSKMITLVYKRKLEVFYVLKEKQLRNSFHLQKIYFASKFFHSFLKKVQMKMIRTIFISFLNLSKKNKAKQNFTNFSHYFTKKTINLMEISFKNIKRHAEKRKILKKFSDFFQKARGNLLCKCFFEKMKVHCSEQIKKEHLKTLKSLGFNKILFLLFEIFQNRTKSYFEILKEIQPVSFYYTKHEKKTSLKEIMSTVENLAKQQRELGIEGPNSGFFIRKKECKMNKLQVEFLFRAVEKYFVKKLSSFWKTFISKSKKNKCKKIENKVNFPRKLTKKEMNDLENKTSWNNNQFI